MSLLDDISAMSVRIEQGTETRQEVYTVMLRALIEIRQLTHAIKILKGIP